MISEHRDGWMKTRSISVEVRGGSGKSRMDQSQTFLGRVWREVPTSVTDFTIQALSEIYEQNSHPPNHSEQTAFLKIGRDTDQLR